MCIYVLYVYICPLCVPLSLQFVATALSLWEEASARTLSVLDIVELKDQVRPSLQCRVHTVLTSGCVIEPKTSISTIAKSEENAKCSQVQ